MKQIKHFWIILLFSLLHGLCCLCCRALGIDDTWALTLLTIAMTFVLAYLRGLRVYFIIAAIILVNVLAYLIGNALPLALNPFLGASMWINVLSTTITTLILGTVFELATNLIFRIGGAEVSVNGMPQNKEFRQRWIVRINDRIVPVKTEQIAFFYSEDKCNFLVTFDGGKFIVDDTMDSNSEMDSRDKALFMFRFSCKVSGFCSIVDGGSSCALVVSVFACHVFLRGAGGGIGFCHQQVVAQNRVYMFTFEVVFVGYLHVGGYLFQCPWLSAVVEYHSLLTAQGVLLDYSLTTP